MFSPSPSIYVTAVSPYRTLLGTAIIELNFTSNKSQVTNPPMVEKLTINDDKEKTEIIPPIAGKPKEASEGILPLTYL